MSTVQPYPKHHHHNPHPHPIAIPLHAFADASAASEARCTTVEPFSPQVLVFEFECLDLGEEAVQRAVILVVEGHVAQAQGLECLATNERGPEGCGAMSVVQSN